jgi:hypothetical protein
VSIIVMQLTDIQRSEHFNDRREKMIVYTLTGMESRPGSRFGLDLSECYQLPTFGLFSLHFDFGPGGSPVIP